jgi:sterol desaturase/sphingolipid hydroxylase (fatty acid hydroxylase superfamily)
MGQLLGIFIGLIGLGVVFGVIERFWPSIRGQRRWRRGVKTDIVYFFWDPFVNKSVAFVAVVITIVAMALVAGVHPDGASIKAWARRDTLLSSQPVWIQAVEILVLADVVGYWSHRLFHEVGQLWRFHLVHHSSQQLDWLSAARVHPLNEAGTRALQAVPFVLLGYSPTVVAGFVPLFTFYAIYLHANVPWNYGPLRFVIASPVFHRWHHTSEAEGLNKNYAGIFPWLDAAFGTLYMPKGRQPQVFGVLDEEVPENLLRQLVYPFRKVTVRALRAGS